MILNFAQTIRKMMGWCPGVTPTGYTLNRQVDFADPSQIPPGGSNVEKFESNNVLFYANTSVFTFGLIVSLNLILRLGQNMDYAVLIPVLTIMYSFFYFLEVKMFQASISVDENSVCLGSFELRDVLLNYNNIKSVKTIRLKKPSMALKAIALIIIVALLANWIISGEWKLIISIAPMLPWYLLVKQRYDREKHDLDVQLYIGSKKKKWYELSPHYTIITDQMTATGIQAAIEQYRGTK